MAKPLIHIGTVEFVALPSGEIKNIPAKIDTGADSSAIWASDIVENSGKLSFTLFGPSSPFYNGQKLSTDHFTTTTIKNSFGNSERRYKVKLKLTIAGRTINTNVTLANRANNRYPILIGRRTLRGKFLVDVARQKQGNHRVLILSTKDTPVIQRFIKLLRTSSKKIEISFARYEDICFVFGESTNQIFLKGEGVDIASFDLVYFKTTAENIDVAATIGHYLKQRGVRFFDQTVATYPANSKLYQYVILADYDIKIPISIFMLPFALAKSYDYLTESLRVPFIVKDVHGSKGNYNYLVSDKPSFEKACRHAAEAEVSLIAQKYIVNESDYRLLVFGKHVELVIERKRQSNSTHLNNTSQGGVASLVATDKLPPAVRQKSLLAAKVLGRDIAGVDMIKDKLTKLWYCLEVNDSPQLASGAFTTEKETAFAAFLEREARS